MRVMKFFGFLNLRGISGQIAALVVASVVTLHLIITASFLIHRPDQPDPSFDRGHSQLAASAHLLGAAPAPDRPRLIGDIARAFPLLGIASLRAGRRAAAEPDGVNLHGLHRRLGSGYRIFALPPDGETRRIGIALPDGAMISANIMPDQRPRPPFLGRPWMMTLLFAVISVTLLGLWAARALTAPLSSFAKAAERFQPQRRRRPAARTRAGRNPFGGEGAEPDARAHHRPDRRPHQDAGRDQPRSAHADHADAAALGIHRGRNPSQPHARRSRPDALDAGIGAVVPAQRPQARGDDAGRCRQHAAADHRPVRRHGPQGRL